MTYWALNAWFLAGVAIIGVLALVRLRRAARAGNSGSSGSSESAGSPTAAGSAGSDGTAGSAGSSTGRVGSGDVQRVGGWLVAVGVTALVLLVMTAVFDNVMIAIGLVGYDPALISGAMVGIAPLEDFAYAIAAVVLLPSLWVLLARSRPAEHGRPAETGGAAS